MKKYNLRIVTLIIILLLTACGGNKVSEQTLDIPAVSGGTEIRVSAETVYKQYCISCHGVDLEGKMASNLQKVGAKLDKAQIMNFIEKGGGGMPAYNKRLDASQIDALAEWLALKK